MLTSSVRTRMVDALFAATYKMSAKGEIKARTIRLQQNVHRLFPQAVTEAMCRPCDDMLLWHMFNLLQVCVKK